MPPQIDILRQVIHWIWQTQASPRVHTLTGGASNAIYQRLQTAYPTIQTHRELDSLLPSKATPATQFNRFLYLRPIQRGGPLLPVLTARFNFGRSHPAVKIRVGLFVLRGDEICGIGYRFESPEGRTHNYYHLQPITGFTATSFFPGLPNWVVDTTPTVPIDAWSPLSLLLNVLVSLYGTDILASALREVGTHLKSEIEGMWSRKLRQTYYRVTVSAGEIFLSGWMDMPQVREYARTLGGGAQIIEITESDFDSADPARKREV